MYVHMYVGRWIERTDTPLTKELRVIMWKNTIGLILYACGNDQGLTHGMATVTF